MKSKDAITKALSNAFWINVYPDGLISSHLCMTKQAALNRCTYTGKKPDAVQVKVQLKQVIE